MNPGLPYKSDAKEIQPSRSKRSPSYGLNEVTLLSNGYKVRSTEDISLEAAKAKLGINLPTMDDTNA